MSEVGINFLELIKIQRYREELKKSLEFLEKFSSNTKLEFETLQKSQDKTSGSGPGTPGERRLKELSNNLGMINEEIWKKKSQILLCDSIESLFNIVKEHILKDIK